MIYSCFDPKSGFYDYYESEEQIPFNADLPVPKLPPAGNDIGVASMEAGRPLPAGAQRIGSGWHARGMLANCGRSGFGAAPWSAEALANGRLLVAAAFAFASYLVVKRWRRA